MTYLTLASAMDGLAGRGFSETFAVLGTRLRALKSGKTFGARDVAIREYHRFEGISDPDDMSIIYALETRDGTRGTLVDAFGVYSNPTVSAFLKDVPIRPTGPVPSRRAS